MSHNHFESNLIKSCPEIVSNLKKSVMNCYNSGGVIYAQKENKEVKLYEFRETSKQGIGLVIFKNNNKYSVYLKFNYQGEGGYEKKTLEKFCGVDHYSTEEILNCDKIYNHAVISFFDGEIQEKDLSSKDRMYHMMKKIHDEKVERGEDVSDIKEILERTENKAGQKELGLELAWSPIVLAAAFECLEKNGSGYILSNDEKEKIKEISAISIPKEIKKFPYIKKLMDTLYISLKKNKNKGYKNSINYNDLDNDVWYEGEHLLFSDQNCLFIYEKKDDKNYKVYYQNAEYRSKPETYKRFKNALKNGTFNDFDIAVEVKDGKVIYTCVFALQNFISDVECSYSVMEESDLLVGAENFNEKLNFEYMRKYVAIQAGMSEQAMVFYAFYVLGGGWYYLPETKGVMMDGTFYSEDIANSDIRIESQHEKDGVYSFSDAKHQFGELNDDWKNGLKNILPVVDKEIEELEKLLESETNDKANKIASLNSYKKRQEYLKTLV